jgi:FtsZ-interacting cell division protein ZipA
VLRGIIIIVLVIAVIVAGLLTLRSSGRTGVPDEEVLKRAAKRAREQAAKDEEADR